MIKKAKWALKEGVLRVKYMLSSDCVFCKIIAGEIKSKAVLENEHVIAINDINPVSAVHVLIIPKTHIESVLTIGDMDSGVIMEMYKAAQKLVGQLRLDSFRLAFNGGKFQHVPHLHMHLVAGKKIQWSKL